MTMVAPMVGRDAAAVDPRYPPASLGVIGGGQLGRMFIQAAQRMGYCAGVLSDTEDAPAPQVAHWTIVGRLDELRTIAAFADRAEAVTVEFENVSASTMRWLARYRPVRPGWRTVWICQNRLREKRFLIRHAIPHAPWCPVRTEDELKRAAATVGLPLILKTAASGYDGKGQILVSETSALAGAWAGLGRAPCVAEAWIDFIAEISVVVARGADGRSVCYPAALNRHERHILDATLMPAPVGPIVAQEARRWALAAAEALGAIGVLTVEFFLTSEGRLLVNEIAPRPHNSGHLTIEAARTSQFEQQVRAVCGLPLGSTDLVMPAAMVNLLGDLWGQAGGEPRWDAALALDPGVSLHLYGKRTPASGRKMGHLTVLDPDPETALNRALAARRALVGGQRSHESESYWSGPD
jgi:5-(carboxyamino)imidazole ribonucleotide synthase